MWTTKSIFTNDYNCKENAVLNDLNKYTDPLWDEKERKFIINYLKSFTPIAVASGIDWCRFRCSQKVIRIAFYSDGYYGWSNNEIHYVDTHYVKVNAAFIKYVLKNRQIVKEQNEVNDYCRNITLDKETLFTQRTYLTPGFNGELWLIPEHIKLNANVLKFLRQFSTLTEISTKDLRDKVNNEKKFILEKIFDYSDFIEIDKTAKKLNIKLEFIEK